LSGPLFFVKSSTMKGDFSFNRPFSRLAGIRIERRKQGPEKPPGPDATPGAQRTPDKGQDDSPDERELFRSAMEGVKPLGCRDTVEPEPADPSSVIRQVQDNRRRQDREVIESLRSLVRGTSRFDVTSTGEYLEGHVASLDPRVMKRLKEGDFAVQAHLDLHGAVREEARTLLGAFVENSHAMGHRCLLVIHGRGLKSETGPVLKEAVVKWLTTGELSRLVLAFCSARPCDGGTGALYVLLKKRPVRSAWKKSMH